MIAQNVEVVASLFLLETHGRLLCSGSQDLAKLVRLVYTGLGLSYIPMLTSVYQMDFEL